VIEGIRSADDMPYPISFAILYRERINSFNNLPKDKQPPRDLWNKPYKLERFLDEAFERKEERSKEFIDLDLEEVE
jgi:hypothetical protein